MIKQNNIEVSKPNLFRLQMINSYLTKTTDLKGAIKSFKNNKNICEKQ